jgi:hypothetical protein
VVLALSLRSQGNLLLRMQTSSSSSAPRPSLSKGLSPSPNPTQHLISLLASSTSPSLTNAAVGAAWLGGKEKNFYLGFLETDSTDKVRRVIRILSGDPKRGGMALDTEESVKVGDKFLVSTTVLPLMRAVINPLPNQADSSACP